MLTRRSFLKLTGASTLAWYIATQTGWTQQAMAQIPGGSLDPGDVPKYVTPLLIPPVMPERRRSPCRAANRPTTTRSP
jgi:spore coat protein A